MFVVLGGSPVPVSIAPVDNEVLRFGDNTEAYDGTALTRRRAHKREWRCTTPWVSDADATSYLSILEATPPIAATGDLTGTINVLATVTGGSTRTVAGGERLRTITFTLREV